MRICCAAGDTRTAKAAWTRATAAGVHLWVHPGFTTSSLLTTSKSWACVPNNYTVPALAPAYDEDICPHWAERWEIRTRPLGCQVSTITGLTSLVSIASTIALALIIMFLLYCFRRVRTYHQQQPAGWWKVWKWDWRTRAAGLWFRSSDRDADAAEQEPILGRSSSSSPSRSRSR